MDDEQRDDRREEVVRLWEEYHRPVLRFFRQRGFSTEDSRDLRQATFLRAAEYYDGDVRNERAWLFSIVRSVWKNHLRYGGAVSRSAPVVSWEDLTSGAGETQVDAAFTIGSGLDDPANRLLWKEEARFLKRAVDDLPKQMRHTVILQLMGYRNKEVAILMQVSPQTVKTHLFQARKRLRKAYEEEFGIGDKAVAEPEDRSGGGE